MRFRELNLRDLQTILLWHQRTFGESNELTEKDRDTLIKIQAMIIYAKDEESFWNKRFRQ
jgi:hypothetical protein